MMKWLVLLPLFAISISLIPYSYAQTTTIITTGQNYDLVEDHINGIATWTSHPERIMVDNSWQNYYLIGDTQKVIFQSNSVGGIIYDIPTCSYSLYENGYDGTQIIPSVSAVATYLKDGSWQNMAVNNESCDVTVSRNNDGIFLTSTRTLIKPFTNSTFANGTTVTYERQTEKFTQEIKIDISSGIKETFKVWNESDEQLGVSQTIHTGKTINIAGNEINIAQYNGQSFDRQFLAANQAEVFEIAQDLNYDFDIGFDSLSGLNIYHDTDYKVNLDYADGNFVNYLEIDPIINSGGTGVYDITALHTHTISTGTIDGIAMTASEISSLQSAINSVLPSWSHTGNQMTVTYTIPIQPAPPQNLSSVLGAQITLLWDEVLDDGGAAIQDYKVQRSTYQYAEQPLPDNQGSDGMVDMASNVLLYHLDDAISQTSVPIMSDDLSSSSNWSIDSYSASYVSVANGVFDGNFPYAPGNKQKNYGVIGIYDFQQELGSGNYADSQWTLRFMYQPQYYENSGVVHYIGLSDADHTEWSCQPNNCTGASQGNEDTIVLKTVNGIPHLAWSDNAMIGQTGSTSAGSSLTLNSWYYVEIKRTSDTTAVMNIWSDDWDGSTNVYSTSTNTLPSTINTMHYMKMSKYGRSGNYEVDNVTFYNGITNASTTHTIPDSSGNGNDSDVISATPTFSTGIIYKQIDSPNFTVTSTGLFDGTDSHTVSGWTRPVSGATGNLISFDNTVSETISYEIETDKLRVKKGTTNIIEATGLTIPTNTNSHIAFTRDNSNNWEIFLDGASVASTNNAVSLGTINTNQYTIGNSLPSLDEFAVFNTDMGAVIPNMYERGNNRFTQLATTGTITTYNDNAITSGNEYTYRIIADNGAFDSEPSNTITETAGTPPDPPTVLTAAINDPDNLPYDTTVSWSTPANVGSGTLTGFEVYRDGVLITTTVLTNTYVDNVPSPNTTYTYYAKAVSNHGVSVASNSDAVTTANVPDAVSVNSITAQSPTQIYIDWPLPYDGGAAITNYQIYRNSTLIDNVLALDYTDSGLTHDTMYYYHIIAQNNIGDAASSAPVSTRTLNPPAGMITHSFVKIVGDTAKITMQVNATDGNPEPTLDNIKVLLNDTVAVTSYINSPLPVGSSYSGQTYFKIPQGTNYNVQTTAQLSNSHSMTTISTTNPFTVERSFTPTYTEAVSGSGNVWYNHTRNTTQDQLTVTWLKDTASFNGECIFMTPSQAQNVRDINTSLYEGVWVNNTDIGFYEETVSITANSNYYVYCFNDDLQFSLISYSNMQDALLSGLSGLETSLGPMLGGPMIIIFVLMIAGQATGRTAPTFIIITVAAVGILTGLGFFAMDEGVWGMILIMSALGVLAGKKFL